MPKVKRRARPHNVQDGKLRPNDFVASVRGFTARRVAGPIVLGDTRPLTYDISAGTHGFVRGIAPGTHPTERILSVDFEHGENTVSVEAHEDDLVRV